MAPHSKAAKKPYRSPTYVVIDATAAKASLIVARDPKDKGTRKMLSLIDKQLDEMRPQLFLLRRASRGGS